jgi:hypothetical protein
MRFPSNRYPTNNECEIRDSELPKTKVKGVVRATPAKPNGDGQGSQNQQKLSERERATRADWTRIVGANSSTRGICFMYLSSMLPVVSCGRKVDEERRFRKCGEDLQ